MFTVTIVLSLGLGVGANVVIVSLAHALLSGATPYPDAARIASVWFTPPGEPGARVLATAANCAALRELSRSFAHIGCVLPERTATLAGDGLQQGRAIAATNVSSQELTAGAVEALAVRPVLGRWFTRDEEQQAEPVAVIGYRLWQRHFDGADDVIGRRVVITNATLSDEVVTVVGVAPPGFHFLDNRTDVWLPLVSPPGASVDAARRLLVVGRLRPDVSLGQAQSELATIARGLAAETPFTNEGWGIRVEPVEAALRQGVGRPLVILQVVVVVVLLIACANVAGLLLADGTSRGGEMAVRSAVGASRWRIVRQCLTETLVLCAAGTGLALVLAWAGLRAVVASFPAGIPGLDAAAIDPSVLRLTLAMLLLTALVSGLAPAWRAARQSGARLLNGAPRRGVAGEDGGRLRTAFVVGQLAGAAALSIGVGLMIQSLAHLHRVDPGVNTSRLATFQVRLDGRGFMRHTGRLTPSGAPETELTAPFFAAVEQIRERLNGLAGVERVTAMAATAPFSGTARRYGFAARGSHLAGTGGQPAVTDWFPILPDYFHALGIDVLQGRAPDASDSATSTPVLVINEAMADELWPGEDPIGREIQLRLFNDPPRQVVGVVADVRYSTASRERLRQAYVPLAQVRPLQSANVARGLELLTFVIRPRGDAGVPGPVLSALVEQVVPHRPVTRMLPLQRYVDDQLDGYRQYVALLALFGVAAVALAIVGAYGLISHTVGLRRHELAVRMALGATRGQVLWLILRRGLTLSMAGLLPGVVGGLMFSGVLEGYLWEVTVTDPVTFTVVPSLLFAVVLGAAGLAGRPVLDIEPARALRDE
jgi:putative ABC transport system permease protein